MKGHGLPGTLKVLIGACVSNVLKTSLIIVSFSPILFRKMESRPSRKDAKSESYLLLLRLVMYVEGALSALSLSDT